MDFISTPRQLLRSPSPLPKTSARTPPNFQETPPGALPVGRLVRRLSLCQLLSKIAEGSDFLDPACACQETASAIETQVETSESKNGNLQNDSFSSHSFLDVLFCLFY